MKKVAPEGCEIQVLICTNEKPEGKTCCKKVGGQEFFSKFKDRMKQTGQASLRWVTRTGCLGYCNDVGTAVFMTKKDGSRKWYSEVTDDDFETIWKEATE